MSAPCHAAAHDTMPLLFVTNILHNRSDANISPPTADSHDVATRRHDPSIAAAPVATSLTG
jgi:hypothetical protein